MIYLDNAATSFPKPEHLLQRGLERYLALGASPGRGGYDRAIEADVAVTTVRRKLARFFGAPENSHVCFAANATDALNILLQGLLATGDHVLSSRLEHNSVLRPLHYLHSQKIIDLELVPFSLDGYIDPAEIARRINPATRLVVLTHASNVLGTVQPIAEVGEICRERNIPLILDAAQTAGAIPIRMQEWNVDGLAFTGHKSLLGPTGIGGLVLAPNLHPRATRFGGTGIDSTNPLQPDEYPSRLEAGTINMLGILCLDETLTFVQEHMAEHYQQEMRLYKRLRDGLKELPRVHLHGDVDNNQHLPVLACTVERIRATDAGAILDGDYEIAVRSGLHCAPLLHEDLGFAGSGTIRFSLGPFTTSEEIDAAIMAMTDLSG